MNKNLVRWILILFVQSFTESCELLIDGLDSTDVLRHVEERNLFLLVGELRLCPNFLSVENVSTSNFNVELVRLLNFSFSAKENRFQGILFARSVGFARFSMEFYFRRTPKHNFRFESTRNFVERERPCARNESNNDEIRQLCPTLKSRDDFFILSKELQIGIKHRRTILDRIFIFVVFLLMTMGTLSIACSLEKSAFLRVLRKPLPLIVGLFTQIVFVPILSIFLTKIFSLDRSTSLGLLSTAASPGGASSNFYTAFLVGDVDLSLMMTFLSTIFSFGTFPLWMWLSNKQQVDVGSLKYPWPNMVLSFVTLFLPTIIGTAVRRFRPALAHRIALFLHPIVFGYLVFLLTFGVYINRYMLTLIELKTIIACCLLPWLSCLGGAVFSWIFIGDRRQMISICIETGIHNTAVSIVFLRLSLSAPESDIALSSPFLVSMSIPIPFLLVFLGRSLIGRFFQSGSELQ